MRVLIIGLGSIAQKHLTVLRAIDPRISVYALRSSREGTATEGVTDIFGFDELHFHPDFIIISNPTSLHYETIYAASEVGVPLFIEKPVLMNLKGADQLSKKIADAGIITYVAFNFRFHPVIRFLKEQLPHNRLIEANVYAGSHLPSWRPGRDYREVYSAKAALGGGVHLDLIHELDYSFWLFGRPDEVKGIQRRISDLDIDSFDFAHYNFLYPHTVVNMTMNYYRMEVKREIELVFSDKVWQADLLRSCVINDRKEVVFETEYNVMDTYKSQMLYFTECLNSGETPMNSFSESLEVLKYCINE